MQPFWQAPVPVKKFGLTLPAGFASQRCLQQQHSCFEKRIARRTTHRRPTLCAVQYVSLILFIVTSCNILQ